MFILYSPRTNLMNRTCPQVQPWLYGYDAIKEVEKAVAQHPEVFVKQTKSRSSTCSVL